MMKYRDDIDLANTWVVSDTHFGHDNIVGFCFRPDDHEQVMIAQWRATVPDDATLLHLGDLAYSNNARFRALTARELPPFTHLDAPTPHKGRKLLIEGNHDKGRRSFYRNSGFNFVRSFQIAVGMQIDGGGLESVDPHYYALPWTVSFSHYPWNPRFDGTARPPDKHFRVHGHIHNNGYTRNSYVPFLRNHINLSVEQTRYTPVNLKTLLDAAILGLYSPTTDAQLDAARARRNQRRNNAL